ncbi:agmatine deiminase family protein [Idiomarina sp. 29L]|uniref:agmatine deiminase family protein n=1 Tax=Idiomarina sp. 29L TaxID=2508877 RepID=UPI00101343A8|nr:agmatine deiminase family protein [Idiomarina sp. 29L]RXS42031.1 agmatine deiminase family protein [Idiomarina sp. 29L]
MKGSAKRWLADFSGNQRLLIAWPYRKDVWRGNAVPAREVIAELVRLVSHYTPVTLLVHPDYLDSIPTGLNEYCSITIERYDDIWLRDTLPLWLYQNEETSGCVFQFDGWGGVQSAVQFDKSLASQVSSKLRRPLSTQALISEGGAFTHNGEGTWLVSLSSIMQRNASFSKEAIKSKLTDYFSGESLYFFEGALVADETHGHMDNMALFLNENTLIYAATSDSRHPDYKTCMRIAEFVKQLPDSIRKVPVPLPKPQRPTTGERGDLEQLQTSLNRTEEVPLLCSYINVLQTESVVIVPEFDLPSDAEALSVIRKAVGDKTVLSAPARELVLGGGGLHCISHNLAGLRNDQTLAP